MTLRYLLPLLLAILALGLLPSCTTTRAPEIQPAVETERQTAARVGQATAPRDGVWIEATETDALRDANDVIWTDDKGEPRPVTRSWRGGWNLTDNSLGGLTDATIGFGQSNGFNPRDGLRVQVGGADVKTGNNDQAILAQGKAEALAKSAAGTAAAQILREHYAGRVAVLESANGVIVSIADGAIGILERVDPVAAGVSLAEKAVIRTRDPATGAVTATEVAAE